MSASADAASRWAIHGEALSAARTTQPRRPLVIQPQPHRAGTFRAALVKRAGNRCEWVDSNGRCVKALGLQAHHTQPGNDDPTTGLLLCTIHHKALDPHAR
jgi:predicted restriction endonuclease